jgi:uncharacterized phage infection (PIP) family protein YhgE
VEGNLTQVERNFQSLAQNTHQSLTNIAHTLAQMHSRQEELTNRIEVLERHILLRHPPH